MGDGTSESHPSQVPRSSKPQTVKVPLGLIEQAVAARDEWPSAISTGETPVARAMAVVEQLAALGAPRPAGEAPALDLSERPNASTVAEADNWEWVLAAIIAGAGPRAPVLTMARQGQAVALLDLAAAIRRYKDGQDAVRRWPSPRDPEGTATPPYPAPANPALAFLLMVASQFLAVDADVTLRELASNAWAEGHVEGYDRAMRERLASGTTSP